MHPIENRISELLQLKDHSDISAILDTISSFVKEKGGDTSPHQVRRIYNEVKKKKTWIELQLLRPKIAYSIARSSEKERYFLGFLEKVIREVKTNEQVPNCITFFESVVAYHKFHPNNK